MNGRRGVRLTRLRRAASLPHRLAVAVRAFRWATAEVRRVRGLLPTQGVKTRARPPERIGSAGSLGVDLALRRVSPTCLERALVLQAWLSVSGEAPDVIVGVRAGENAVEAHAWMAGDDSWHDSSYGEITRLRFDAPE